MDIETEQGYNEAFDRLPLILKFPLPFVNWIMPRYDLEGMFMEGIKYQLKKQIQELKSQIKQNENKTII